MAITAISINGKTKQNLAFDLTYYTDCGPRTERVYMVRHHADCRLGETADSFSVVRCSNDEIINTDDTKEDAIIGAQIDLHQWSDFGTDIYAMRDMPSPMTGRPYNTKGW